MKIKSKPIINYKLATVKSERCIVHFQSTPNQSTIEK